MNCRPGDIVMVVRSEIGNEGRIGRIVARATPGAKLPNDVFVYRGDDWIVEGRFNTADENIMSIGGVDVARWDSDHHEVSLLPFPDAWLRPIRGDGLGDETPTDVEQPQTVEA